jgi:hypothetical protein
MLNQLQLSHEYLTIPDKITVKLNDMIIYQGLADIEFIDFVPVLGLNKLSILLDTKSKGNFYYNNKSGQVEKDSKITIKEIIVESRYFRSLVTKCGLVEIDLKKNIHFPLKYLAPNNILTMEGSEYLIKFDYPIKNWMQIHRHGRDLDVDQTSNQLVKERLKYEIPTNHLLPKT